MAQLVPTIPPVPGTVIPTSRGPVMLPPTIPLAPGHWGPYMTDQEETEAIERIVGGSVTGPRLVELPVAGPGGGVRTTPMDWRRGLLPPDPLLSAVRMHLLQMARGGPGIPSLPDSTPYLYPPRLIPTSSTEAPYLYPPRLLQAAQGGADIPSLPAETPYLYPPPLIPKPLAETPYLYPPHLLQVPAAQGEPNVMPPAQTVPALPLSALSTPAARARADRIRAAEVPLLIRDWPPAGAGGTLLEALRVGRAPLSVGAGASGPGTDWQFPTKDLISVDTPSLSVGEWEARASSPTPEPGLTFAEWEANPPAPTPEPGLTFAEWEANPPTFPPTADSATMAETAAAAAVETDTELAGRPLVWDPDTDLARQELAKMDALAKMEGGPYTLPIPTQQDANAAAYRTIAAIGRNPNLPMQQKTALQAGVIRALSSGLPIEVITAGMGMLDHPAFKSMMVPSTTAQEEAAAIREHQREVAAAIETHKRELKGEKELLELKAKLGLIGGADEPASLKPKEKIVPVHYIDRRTGLLMSIPFDLETKRGLIGVKRDPEFPGDDPDVQIRMIQLGR